MARHGIFVTEAATTVQSLAIANSAIPFVIGVAPVQSADSPADIGMPELCTSFADFKKKFGYSDDWGKYNLCEFAYSHFVLYNCQPVIFCNLLAPETMSTFVAATDISLNNGKAILPIDAIADANLVVKPNGGTGSAYVKDTDYAVFYSGESLVIEVLPNGAAKNEEGLNITYKKVNTTSVTAAAVAAGLESIEYCASKCGIVPDLICAPGYSHDASVAAAMATKAEGINSMFHAIAIVDIDCASGQATTHSAAIAVKEENHMIDKNQIVCWPMVSMDGKKYHLSTHLAGLMAKVDAENDGCPAETPSNKALKIDSIVLADGTEVNQTYAMANTLNEAGITTGLIFLGNIVAWGDHTACYPTNTDIKDSMIPVARMAHFLRSTLIETCWHRLDKPMKRRELDSIVDEINVWMNSLTTHGYLYGGRAELPDELNSTEDLMNGIARIHLSFAPPAPLQEINIELEYNADYVVAAFAS